MCERSKPCRSDIDRLLAAGLLDRVAPEDRECLIPQVVQGRLPVPEGVSRFAVIDPEDTWERGWPFGCDELLSLLRQWGADPDQVRIRDRGAELIVSFRGEQRQQPMPPNITEPGNLEQYVMAVLLPCEWALSDAARKEHLFVDVSYNDTEVLVLTRQLYKLLRGVPWKISHVPVAEYQGHIE